MEWLKRVAVKSPFPESFLIVWLVATALLWIAGCYCMAVGVFAAGGCQ